MFLKRPYLYVWYLRYLRIRLRGSIMEKLMIREENMRIVDKPFKTWIKISHYDSIYDITSGIEVSEDLDVRLFKIPVARSNEFRYAKEQESSKNEPNIIYSKLIHLSDTQQLFLKEKRDAIDFNLFKNSYVNPMAYDGSRTTFEIFEDGFSKIIEKTSFDMKMTEYEILRRFINDLYSVIEKEEFEVFYR
jgi:hypothetical protein